MNKMLHTDIKKDIPTERQKERRKDGKTERRKDRETGTVPNTS